jgi:hypothetical protein
MTQHIQKALKRVLLFCLTLRKLINLEMKYCLTSHVQIDREKINRISNVFLAARHPYQKFRDILCIVLSSVTHRQNSNRS